MMWLSLFVLSALGAGAFWCYRRGMSPRDVLAWLRARAFGFIDDADEPFSVAPDDFSPRLGGGAAASVLAVQGALGRPPRRGLDLGEEPPVVGRTSPEPESVPAPVPVLTPPPRVAAPSQPLPRAELITSIPRHLVKKRAETPSPAGATSALPEISLNDVQRNLETESRRRQRRETGQGAPEPALPTIAPETVRETVRQLHPKPVVSEPSKGELPLLKVDLPRRNKPVAPPTAPPSFRPAADVVFVPPKPAAPRHAQQAPSVPMPREEQGWVLPPQAPAASQPPVTTDAAPFRPASEVVFVPAVPATPTLAEPVVAAPVAVTPQGVLAVRELAPARPAPAATAPAPVPPAAQCPPAAASAAIGRGDLVWHLLEDEAPEQDVVADAPDAVEGVTAPVPVEAGAAAQPVASAPAVQPAGLVWQVLDDTPVPLPPETPSAHASGLAWQVVDSAPAASEAASWHELPALELLLPASTKTTVCDQDALIERGIVIEEKLAEFKVKVAVVDAYAGPVITRYEVEPAVGVRGNQVVNLMKDLSRALGLASIRVVETIPGKTCMGLELPNPTRQMIRLSEIVASDAFQGSRSRLTLCLGHDITGEPVVTDLAKAPHLLVAGTTGSGKSVGVNAMIVSMLYKATPDEVRFIMIDPKMLELSVYNDIPHLLAPVVTDMKLAANALNWCVGEMEKRYRLMSALGVRNLAGYNQKVREAAAAGHKLTNPFTVTPDDPEPLEPMPFIVVVVDEFADLMMVAGKKIEELIARLAQKARAAGIHLILATQRPSVDVITGLIKANIPTRISFQVSSKIDSRTILDQMGAESLLGQGDMLFLPPGTGYPQRVHGAFVTDDEVHAIVEHLKSQGEPCYVEGLLTGEAAADDEQQASTRKEGAESDPLYDEAVEIVLRTRKASISSVQRHLRIGYNRAARLIEEMEASGIVSAMESNGNRTVLVPSRE